MSLAHYVPTNGNTMPAWVRVSDLSLAREGPDQRANLSLWRPAILYPFWLRRWVLTETLWFTISAVRLNEPALEVRLRALINGFPLLEKSAFQHSHSSEIDCSIASASHMCPSPVDEESAPTETQTWLESSTLPLRHIRLVSCLVVLMLIHLLRECPVITFHVPELTYRSTSSYCHRFKRCLPGLLLTVLVDVSKYNVAPKQIFHKIVSSTSFV